MVNSGPRRTRCSFETKRGFRSSRSLPLQLGSGCCGQSPNTAYGVRHQSIDRPTKSARRECGVHSRGLGNVIEGRVRPRCPRRGGRGSSGSESANGGAGRVWRAWARIRRELLVGRPADRSLTPYLGVGIQFDVHLNYIVTWSLTGESRTEEYGDWGDGLDGQVQSALDHVRALATSS